jgi:hypothetical protein
MDGTDSTHDGKKSSYEWETRIYTRPPYWFRYLTVCLKHLFKAQTNKLTNQPTDQVTNWRTSFRMVKPEGLAILSRVSPLPVFTPYFLRFRLISIPISFSVLQAAFSKKKSAPKFYVHTLSLAIESTCLTYKVKAIQMGLTGQN